MPDDRASAPRELSGTELDVVLDTFTINAHNAIAGEIDIQSGLDQVKSQSPAEGPQESSATKGEIPPVKVVVAGGVGVGKSAFISSVSETVPLTTEAVKTNASFGVDDLAKTPDKQTTTVSTDFGRVSLDSGRTLHLFGAPGQQHFWFMWDDLVKGALGAVVLVDTRRLADCFPAIDYFEEARLPFVVAINGNDGYSSRAAPEVRATLALSPEIPIVQVDARDGTSIKASLTALVEHASAIVEPMVEPSETKGCETSISSSVGLGPRT